ncbi:MAG: 50S ribosomal protein L25 [Chloroflexi bacterium]|nr:50S ribosomal protein L25 [Chloroflexota bacterium]
MDKIELEAAHRETLGKKVKQLRRREITPAHLFGHDVASLALQCQTAEIKRALTQAGRTGLINLKLDTAKKPRSVLIREIQKNPCTGELLHVDFYEVKTTEKIKVDVPVVLVGEAPALKLKDNILIQELDSLSVECFPDKIPTSFKIDLSSLAEAEQAIRVKDLTLAEGVAFTHEDPELIVVKISVAAAARVEEEEVVAEALEAAPAPEETAEE